VTILVVPTVRPAHPDDAEALAGLHIRGWQHAYARLMPAAYLAGLDGQLEQRIVRRRQQILRPIARTACFVAVEPETSRVTGFFNAEPYRIAQNGSDLSDSVGEVYAIYVEPDRISTGAGRALMDAAVGWLDGQGLDPIHLWVLEGNLRALSFYERYGFRLDGGRSTFVLEQPGELPVELAEVRLTLDHG
jgi:GNAT superfamily N-acetyltransferase